MGSEDFMKDGLVSKYLFDSSEEKKFPETATWRDSRQKKKHIIKCYVFLCFAFTICMFLIYGYYDHPFREETGSQKDDYQGGFSIDTNNGNSNKDAEQDVLITKNNDES